MIGYKAFDRKLCCRGFQYEIGKTYTKDVKKKDMKLCTDTVFHFCREIQEIEHCSSYNLKKSRICEVIAGDVVRSDGKYGTNKITILREIKGKEKSELLDSGLRNTGYGNTGSNNSGSYNSGVSNSGDMNTGNCNKGSRNAGYSNMGNRNSGNENSGNYNSGNQNVGRWNTGDGNSGHFNSGNSNFGDRNSGWLNSGNYNTGGWNSGNYNTGFCNSNTPTLRIFNKESNINDLDELDIPNFFYFDLVHFVGEDGATKKENEWYKEEIETCGGFLRETFYKKAWRKSWDAASDEDRRKVLKLPNWDNEVFKEISGIDVEKELGIKKEE